jgi:hypothetical protein
VTAGDVTLIGTVAFAMAGSLSKCAVVLFVCQQRSRVRFPPDVIVIAVRWYLLAPRGVSSYPRHSWEELEGRCQRHCCFVRSGRSLDAFGGLFD